LSIYADADHTAVKHSIPLSEITAVARQRTTKRPGVALFTVFTPPRNFHFDARLDDVADQWVHEIRVAARIDEWEDGALGTSEEDVEGTAISRQITSTQPIPIRKPTTVSNNNPYAAPMASFSSISSFGAANFPESTHSLSLPVQPVDGGATKPALSHSLSSIAIDEEKVLRNGWLHLLKSKGGVKKWKPVWAVLRPKSVAVYPNEQVSHLCLRRRLRRCRVCTRALTGMQEYSPILIIAFPTIVNAVEIDSPSRNKKRQFCMQIITEERGWRFCAQDDDDLARWLGTIKSVLAKRRATMDVSASS
jgi:hypothetical protein